jgi:hypothetical protein
MIDIFVLVVTTLALIPVIIGSVALGLRLLGQMIQVDSIAYIDEETEDYINSPNRWD